MKTYNELNSQELQFINGGGFFNFVGKVHGTIIGAIEKATDDFVESMANDSVYRCKI